MGKRVLCCGTFDYLHPGHISFLQQAKILGTKLYVVVGRDENVHRIKGHYPEQSEQERLENLVKLEQVDDVRLGYPGGVSNFLKVVADIQPHIIALGYDQKAPPSLGEAFPECEIVVLQPHFPEKFKSSLFRRNKSATEY